VLFDQLHRTYVSFAGADDLRVVSAILGSTLCKTDQRNLRKSNISAISLRLVLVPVGRGLAIEKA
jgi:hypothetical protein